MAPGLKTWLTLVLGGGALVAAWALPPRTQGEFYELFYPGSYGRMEPTVEQMAYSGVRGRLNRAAETYQKLLWRDSLAALAEAAREASTNLVVRFPPGQEERYEAGLRAALALQLGAMGAPEPSVPVGIVFMEVDALAHPSQRERLALLPTYWEELLASNEPADPYCFVVAPVGPLGEDGSHRDLERHWSRMVEIIPGAQDPNPLGPCAFYARYGVPGGEIARWLGSRGFTFAMGAGAGGRLPWDPNMAAPRALRRGLFGARSGYYSDFFVGPRAEKCLMGSTGSCLRAIADSVPSAYYPLFLLTPTEDLSASGDRLAVRLYRYTRMSLLAGDDLDLFRDLEEEFGGESFQRFWSSDLPLEGAFRAAFGVSPGDWVMARAQARLGVLEEAPPVRAGATLLTLMLVALLAGVAVVAQDRRG